MFDARIFVRSARSWSASEWSPSALSKLILMHQPFMPLVRTALAAVALRATPAMAADVITQVGESARQTLVEQAPRSGLAEPKVEVTVQSTARNERACSKP